RGRDRAQPRRHRRGRLDHRPRPRGRRRRRRGRLPGCPREHQARTHRRRAENLPRRAQGGMTRGGAVALMVAAPVLWSTAGVVTRHIDRTEPIEQVFWRSFFAFAFVAGFLLFSGKNPLRAARAAGIAGLFSGALWAVMFTAFVLALSLTTTANTLVMMSIAPLLTVVCARIVLTDPIPLRTWLAALAAMAGIAVMFGSSVDDTRHVGGMLVALVIPVASALNVVALRKHAATVDLIPAVMVGGALSALVALPLALPISASGKDLALLAFLGVFQLGLPCMFLVMASRALLAPE